MKQNGANMEKFKFREHISDPQFETMRRNLNRVI